MYVGGEAISVLVYNPSESTNKFYKISGQSLIWQGNYKCWVTN